MEVKEKRLRDENNEETIKRIKSIMRKDRLFSDLLWPFL